MIEFGHTLADAGRQFLENYDPFSDRTDKRSLESYKDEHIAELTKQMADAATSKADGS